MLNEVPNNNDVKYVVNIVLNEAPNSNDTTCIGNNVRLTAVVHNNSQWQLYSHHTEKPSYRKADLPETRDNETITRKVCTDRNKLCPGKEWRLYTQ